MATSGIGLPLTAEAYRQNNRWYVILIGLPWVLADIAAEARAARPGESLQLVLSPESKPSGSLNGPDRLLLTSVIPPPVVTTDPAAPCRHPNLYYRDGTETREPAGYYCWNCNVRITGVTGAKVETATPK